MVREKIAKNPDNGFGHITDGRFNYLSFLIVFQQMKNRF